jgi:hypothetical protein
VADGVSASWHDACGEARPRRTTAVAFQGSSWCRSASLCSGIARPSGPLSAPRETWACSSRHSPCAQAGIAHSSPRVWVLLRLASAP